MLFRGSGIVNNSSNVQTFTAAGAGLGYTFWNSATAGNATFSISSGAAVTFGDTSSAGTAIINLNDGDVLVTGTNPGPPPGPGATLANAKVTASNGSSVRFLEYGSGGQAEVTLVGAESSLEIYQLTSAGAAIGSLAGTEGVVLLGNKQLTVGGNNLSTNYGGLITGSGGSIVKEGAGNWTLSGSNNYTGGTTINAGTISIAANDNLGDTSGGLTFGGGMLRTTATFAMSRATTLNVGGGAFDVASATTLTHSGAISGAGRLTKSGDGQLILNGVNTYEGGTTINDGYVTVSANTALGHVNGGLVFNGGTLRTMANITMSRATTLNAGGGTFEVGTNLTHNGVISGSGRLTMASSGTLVLTGANDYQGGTRIHAGTISIAANNNLGDASGGLTFSGGGTLRTTAAFIMSRATTLNAGGGTFDVATMLRQDAVIDGAGGLTKTGAGTLVLNGSNTYQGGTTINAGTITVVANDNLGNAAGTLTFGGGTLRTLSTFTMSRETTLNAGGGTFDVEPGTTLTQGGVIDGAGGLTKAGNGTLVLTGINTYGGGTTINAGTITVVANNNLGNGAGTLSFDGGTLHTIGNIVMARATTLNAGGGTFEVTTGTTLLLNDVIGGAGGLTKTGGGTLILAGVNTYLGGTTIDGGAISISSDANIGAASGTLTFGGGTLQTTANVSMSRATTLNAGGGTFDVASGTTLTHDGVIGGAGTLTKAGTGTLVLTAANTYWSGTRINAGTISIAGNNNLGDAGGGLVFGGGALQTTATFTLSRTTTLNTGGTFDVASGTTLTHSGMINGAGGLIKTGAGTLVLTHGANNYQGGTTINAGTISIASNSPLGFGPSSLTFNGGTLQTTATFLMSRATTLNAGGGTFEVASGTTLIHNGEIGGTGGLIKTGEGDLSLNSTNSYQGGTTINAGTLSVDANSRLGNANGGLAFGGGTLRTTADISMSRATTLNAGGGTFEVASSTTLIQNGAIGGAGGLTKTGAGTLTLAGVNTYQGGTTINGGTLFVSSNDRLGEATGGLTFDGGTLMAISSFTMSRATTLNAGGGTILVALSQSLTQNGVIGGTGGLTKTGLGALVLTAVNTYQGDTTINAGTLALSGSGSIASSSGLDLAAAGTTFTIEGSSGNQTIQDLSGVAGSTVALGNHTLTAGTTNSTTFRGVIADNGLGGALGGSFTKIGSGTLTLEGDNTYTGATTVSAGTLALANGGRISESAVVTVASDATFDISNNVFINNIKTLAGAGTVQLGANVLRITDGSTEFSGVIKDGGNFGGIEIRNGTLTLSGASTFTGPAELRGGGTLALKGAGSMVNAGVDFIGGPGTATFDISQTTSGASILGLIDTGFDGGVVALGSKELKITVGSPFFSGVIQDGGIGGGTGGSLRIASLAVQVLTGVNTYTGATTIEGNAALILEGNGSIATSSSLNLTGATAIFDIACSCLTSVAVQNLSGVANSAVVLGDANLTVISSIDTTFSGFIMADPFGGPSNGGLVKEGTATLTLGGANTYTGGTTIKAGAIAVSSDGNLGDANGGVTFDGGALKFLASFDLENTRAIALELGGGTIDTNGFNTMIAQAIGGSGGLTKAGSGTLTLAEVNTYLGATTINAGTLALSGNGSISDSSLVTVASGATFDISASSFGFNPIQNLAGSGTVQLGNNGLVIRNASGEFGGTLVDGGGFGGLQIFAGSMTLTNVSTYRNVTQVWEGATLALKGAGSIANSLYISFAPTAGHGTAVFDISQTTAGASVRGLFDPAAGGIGVINLGGKTLTITNLSGTFNGVLQDGGLGGGSGGGLTLAAGAYQGLGGTNTYTGATTVGGNATLILEGAGSIAASSGVNLTAAGATFDISGSTINQTVKDLTGVAGSLVTLGSNTLIAGTSNSTTFGGVISGGGGFTKQGSGTLVFTANNAYTGVTAVSAGILQLGNGGTTGMVAGNVVLASGAILAFNRSDDITFGGDISGDGAVSYMGPGLVTVTGTSSYTGGTAITGGGGVQIGSDAALGGAGSMLTLSDGAIQATASFTSTRAITLGAGGGIVDTNSFDVSLMGAIGGGGGLTKSGDGTLFLGGVNTYSGGTTVWGGVLLGTTASLQGNIVNDATVGFSQSTNGVYAGNISGSGNLIITGTGTVTLTGTNTYTGGTIVSGGVLLGTTTSLQGNIINNATVGFAQGTDGVYAGNMSGTGGLIKTGTGTVMLTGTNTYTGGTLVSGGTLVGTAESLQGDIVNNAAVGFDATSNGTYAGTMSGSGALAVLGAGTLILTGNNTYTGGTTILGGSTLQLGNGGTTGMIAGNVGIESGGVLAFNRSDNITFAGNISGDGAVAYMGPGIVTLTGANTYTGGTAIVGGTVQAGSDSAFGEAGAMLTLAGGTIQATASFTSTRPVTLAGGGGTFDTNSNALTLAGVITGPGKLTKTGAGTLILTADNTYTGGTVISGGILQLGNGGTTGMIAGDVINNGVLAFNRSDNVTFAGDISGSGSIAYMGPGTVTLTGSSTYTGGTAISGGTVQAGSDSAFGAAGTTLTLVGGTLQATASFTIARPITLTTPGGTFDTNGNTLTLQGAISGTGGLTKTGAGTLVLAGTNSYSGGTTVTAGILQGTTSSLQGNITNNATVVFSQSTGGTYAGSMSGTGGLSITGAGNVTLTGTNSYSGGTTVSGGTLTGTTSSLQGNILNNAAVVFDQSTDGTYGGAMSGTGGLTLTGPGNVTLTGANTYSGGTTVSGGTLTGTTTSLQGNILNNAAVVFGQSTDGTYSGAMSGTGGLTKNGAGNLTLTGANTYSGGTTVSGGVLLGTTTSLQGNIVNNAAVVFGQSTDGTYSGAMSGTGGLTKNGAGNLTLTGTNTYTGGTMVSGGTLTGTTSSLQGNIVNNAALVFDQSTNGTYAGAITGTGSLTKTGTGLLSLTGNNVVGGGTTVSAGVLAVNGSLTSNVVVGTGGMIGGSGTIIGQLTSTNGTVAPGNSIGTLNVTGNFVQNGGIYQVEANSGGQNDKIVATGTATLGGGATVQVLAASGTYQRNTTYTIVTATGGLTGTYSGVTSNLAFLTPSLSYDANNVYLLLAQTANAFAAGAQTLNQFAVGTALDIASPTATGDFNTVLNALAGLNTQQGPAALDAISGQPYTGFGTVNVGASLVFMNALGQQVAQARNGGPGTTRVALAEACVVACDSQGLPKWGAWISGLGGFGSVGGNTNAGTLTYNLGGGAVGVDYRLDPRFLVGLAVGYSSGRQWVNGFMGNGNADNYSAALYASFNQGGLYVDALAGYAYSDNRLQRVMAIPGLATRIASGQTGANQFLGQIEAGYRIGLLEAAQATITPFARFQTVAVSQNAFNESGAQSLNLSVTQQNTTSVRTIIGADLGANIPVGMERPLGVTIRLGWAHEYADTARPMTAAFAGAPAVPFTVYGAQPLRDAAVVGLGLNAQIGASTSIYARYDGEITGRDDTHSLSAGFRMTW
ncbi:autotransporter-associated beta strand repeat-containing protein [Reyranella sp.]|uniref:autotransporter-associated beta strand repeat-containing protein n=1 Tax=Reyranella sp. TaxID=1929291 RepID=UPI0025E2E9CC|nr:autotransporter-associated beta strand repeat-containing protein [Reyranella sp.]